MDEASTTNNSTPPAAPPIRWGETDAEMRAHHRIPNVIIGLLLLALIVGGTVFVFFKGVDVLRSMKGADDYPGPGDTEIVITIPFGASAESMATLLYEHDVVMSPEAFTEAAYKSPAYFQTIQAGDYVMLTRMNALDALKLLADNGNTMRQQFTVPEGLRNTQVFAKISETIGVPITEFEIIAANPEDLPLPDWARGQTEGFLFPNTYSYDSTPTALEALWPMVSEFNRVINEIEFVETAQAIGVDPYDAVTVAGIIEKEGADPRYARDIASVIYNRLALGMNLELDSTVIYANNMQGTLSTDEDQRNIDSPYNTYRYAGLPPGAISNPGRIALEAAVHPTTTDYLYFVATNPSTGETKFASTWEGHQANVAEFEAWCSANVDMCLGNSDEPPQ
jgi:UPF0755 protein